MVRVFRPARLSAFEGFYREYFPRTRAVLALTLGDLDQAEDATQEAFVRAFGRWKSIRGLDHPEKWLFVVALNIARDDHRRRQRRRRADGGIVADEGFDERIDDRLDIIRALKLLPPRQRQVLVLRYLAGMSTAETAHAMGCAEGTVRASLVAAVRNIGDRIGEREP